MCILQTYETHLMKKFALPFFLALMVAISGCAGTPFKWEQARQLKEGMAESEVIQLMGSPYMVKSTPESTVWIWSYSDGFSGIRTVSISIKDGKVVKAPSIPSSFN